MHLIEASDPAQWPYDQCAQVIYLSYLLLKVSTRNILKKRGVRFCLHLTVASTSNAPYSTTPTRVVVFLRTLRSTYTFKSTWREERCKGFQGSERHKQRLGAQPAACLLLLFRSGGAAGHRANVEFCLRAERSRVLLSPKQLAKTGGAHVQPDESEDEYRSMAHVSPSSTWRSSLICEAATAWLAIHQQRATKLMIMSRSP